MKKTLTILVTALVLLAGSSARGQFATQADSSDVAGWKFTTFTDVDDSLKDGYQIYQKIDTCDAVIDSAVGAERAADLAVDVIDQSHFKHSQDWGEVVTNATGYVNIDADVIGDVELNTAVAGADLDVLCWTTGSILWWKNFSELSLVTYTMLTDTTWMALGAAGDSARDAAGDSIAGNWDEWLHVSGDAGTGAFDFGGATSLEIPNAANPTTDAEGEIAWDSDDDAIEVYSGDESESVLIPMYQKIDGLIDTPDGIADEIAIFRVDALLYPHGIELDQLSITTSVDGAYSMVFEEWSGDPPAAENDIETVTTGASDSYKEVASGDIDDATIDADDYIFLHVPSTDIDWIHFQIIFHVTEGD